MRIQYLFGLIRLGIKALIAHTYEKSCYSYSYFANCKINAII